MIQRLQSPRVRGVHVHQLPAKTDARGRELLAGAEHDQRPEAHEGHRQHAGRHVAQVEVEQGSRPAWGAGGRPRFLSRIHSEDQTPMSSGAGIQPIRASRKVEPPQRSRRRGRGEGRVAGRSVRRRPPPRATRVSTPSTETMTFMIRSSSPVVPQPRIASTDQQQDQAAARRPAVQAEQRPQRDRR